MSNRVGLTLAERVALERFADGLRGIYALPTCHPDDLREITVHVHAIQNAVMARAAVRAHPEDFTHEAGFESIT